MSQCIKKLLPVLPVLQLAWSASLYSEGGPNPKTRASGEEAPVSRSYHGFQPEMVTAAASDPLFRVRCHIVHALDESLEAFSKWAGGCQCHGDLVQELGQPSWYERLVSAHSPTRSQSCPMAGRRAPEMAAKLAAVLEEAFTKGHSMIYQHLQSRTTPADLRSFLAEYDQAKMEIVGLLSVKLDFWRRMPWLLAGVASVDPVVAQD